MVERIMLFKLNEPATRDELASRTLATLSKIDDLEELSVGVPADDPSAKSWDLSVVMGVANVALLNAVLGSTAFTNYLDDTMKDRYEVLKAWTFERLG
ncbi:MAG TPA: Dabb family protein [Polyangiaceae bacterium]|nr:Dabb family protein [Polyangiaceae bacterium]